MPACFHVGCTSGHNGSNYKPCHLFKLPKQASDEIRQEWLRNIPKRKGVVFDVKKNSLCHLHFDDKFIVKNVFINYCGAGGENLVPFERKNWTLSKDAVPTLFENEKVSSVYNRPIPKRRSITKRQDPVPKKLKPNAIQSQASSPVLDTSLGPCSDNEGLDSRSSVISNEIEYIVPPTGWHTNSLDGVPSATFYQLGHMTNDFFYDIHKLVKVSW